jgi:hypothetical protein
MDYSTPFGLSDPLVTFEEEARGDDSREGSGRRPCDSEEESSDRRWCNGIQTGLKATDLAKR